MSVHRLEWTQFVPISIEEAWRFFSDPHNLATLTPPDMGFEVTSHVAPNMYAGMMIPYRVRPLLGIPTRWLTEITHVEPRRFFVDEQRRGPYRLWHHEHHFAAVAGGVEMRDLVHYELPFGPLGDVVERLVVRPRIEGIFAYRKRVLAGRFGSGTLAGATEHVAESSPRSVRPADGPAGSAPVGSGSA